MDLTKKFIKLAPAVFGIVVKVKWWELINQEEWLFTSPNWWRGSAYLTQ